MNISIALTFVAFCLGIPVLGFASGQRTGSENSLKDEIVNVKIRALGSSIHAGTENQDTYLAEIVSKSNGSQLVNLIDVYGAEASGINRDVLKNYPKFRMKVSRSPFCDVVANRFFLSQKSILFDTTVTNDLVENASRILPCYKVIHGSVRIVGNDHLKSE
jgi:hypothetical protein